jgi:hypothetical protein
VQNKKRRQKEMNEKDLLDIVLERIPMEPEAGKVKALAEAGTELQHAKEHEDDLEVQKLKLENDSQKIEYDFKLNKERNEIERDKLKTDKEIRKEQVKNEQDKLKIERERNQNELEFKDRSLAFEKEKLDVERERLTIEQSRMEVDKDYKMMTIELEANKLNLDSEIRRKQIELEFEKLKAEMEKIKADESAQAKKARNELISQIIGLLERASICGISVLVLSKLIVGVITMEEKNIFPSTILSKEVFGGIAGKAIGWFARNIFK